MGGGGGGGSAAAADYVCGAVAGAANIGVGFPFDTVKVRLQNTLCPYSGPWHAAKSIVRYEGASALYRGLSPQLIGGALETGVNYAVFAGMMSWSKGAGVPEAAAVPLSAGVAGVVLSFVLSPAELVKCRLQVGATERYHSYSGPLDCLRQTVRTEGLRGLMRGLSGTMARECPGNAVYFSVYHLLRRWLPGKAPDASAADPSAAASSSSGDGSSGSGGSSSSGGTPPAARQSDGVWSALADAGSAIVCGGLAGMAMWATILPLDVAKTRIQTAYPGSYYDVGILRQLRLLHREGGPKALYAGLSPTLVRAFPANAAQWLGWELCMQQWRRWERGSGGSSSSNG